MEGRSWLRGEAKLFDNEEMSDKMLDHICHFQSLLFHLQRKDVQFPEGILHLCKAGLLILCFILSLFNMFRHCVDLLLIRLHKFCPNTTKFSLEIVTQGYTLKLVHGNFQLLHTSPICQLNLANCTQEKSGKSRQLPTAMSLNEASLRMTLRLSEMTCEVFSKYPVHLLHRFRSLVNAG